MILVLALGAGLWGLGTITGASRQARVISVALLLIVVIALHVALPDAHPVRLATGESAGPWVFLLAAGAVVLIYRQGLRRLRARVTPPAPDPSAKAKTFSETELNRYARHIVLREIGGVGQRRLRDARVLVVGAGGLGSPVLQYLGAAGIGTIGVIDADVVDNANLQRQVIYPDASIGTPKVFAAADAVAAQNPYVTLRPYHRALSAEIAGELIADYDLVLDGTDDTATRYAVNAACVANGVPLISGALSQWEGQVSVFDPSRDAPCYACLFPDPAAPGLAPTCAEAGVLGPLPGVVGSMMAVEAVKLLTHAGAPLRGEMLIYDALYGETRKIVTPRRPDCAVCGG